MHAGSIMIRFRNRNSDVKFWYFDQQKLKDILPADLYTRWSGLKKIYMGNNKGVEKTRPIFASQKLFDKALKKTGLTNDTGITKKLRKVAKKNKLELIQPKIVIDL